MAPTATLAVGSALARQRGGCQREGAPSQGGGARTGEGDAVRPYPSSEFLRVWACVRVRCARGAHAARSGAAIISALGLPLLQSFSLASRCPRLEERPLRKGTRAHFWTCRGCCCEKQLRFRRAHAAAQIWRDLRRKVRFSLPSPLCEAHSRVLSPRCTPVKSREETNTSVCLRLGIMFARFKPRTEALRAKWKHKSEISTVIFCEPQLRAERKSAKGGSYWFGGIDARNRDLLLRASGMGRERRAEREVATWERRGRARQRVPKRPPHPCAGICSSVFAPRVCACCTRPTHVYRRQPV